MGSLRIQNWSLGKVARAVGGQLWGASVEAGRPGAVATDTRKLEGGELFFALRGERFDGHDFVDDAVDAGVCTVVVDDDSSLGDRQTAAILVDDTTRALGRLGRALFFEASEAGLNSIAVTGSNGKTTTKELLAALWGNYGEVWATPGNLNNHIGVPLTLCSMPDDCDHLIVEMGANHQGEIEELIRLAPAGQRIITSIGRAHLEGFGSLSGVRRAKSEIFGSANADTTAVVPAGERKYVIPGDFPGSIVTFGEEEDAHVRVLSMDVDRGRYGCLSRVTLGSSSRQWTLSLPLVGRHNAWNLSAAFATLLVAGFEPEEPMIDRALQGLELPGGRLRVVEVGELRILDDAYNANPSSMRASFRAFEQWCAGEEILPKIAVIGDMYELGDFAVREHRQLAEWLSGRRDLSALVFVGDTGPAMVEAASDGRVNEVLAQTEPAEIARWLADRGPARVFLKGSRANRLEQIVEELESIL